MTVSQAIETPATIQMLDPSRGDLFVVLTEKAHFVIQIDEAIFGADTTIGRFQRGYVQLDRAGQPNLVRVDASEISTRCRPLICASPCPQCGDVVQPAGSIFVCRSCGGTI